MITSIILKKFENLKNAILKDGKVDENEIAVLLDFIDMYVRAGNQIFVDLYKALIKAKKDGKVSKEESNMLIDEINKVSIFIQNESKIETCIAIISGMFLIGVIIYHYFF